MTLEPGERTYPLEEPETTCEAEKDPGTLERWSLPGSLIGLAALLLFHAFQLASWTRGETRPPAWDQSVQLEIAIDYRRAIAAGRWGELLRLKPKPGMPPFPPLYHLSILYATGLEDPASAALWVNWLYLAVLCVSLWGLGRRFVGDWAGLGAAAVFSCVPEVQWLYREQLVDLALTAWVAASYWALAASRSFERRIPAVLFGVLFAAGMLTKWSAFSYYLPALWIAAGAVRDPKGRAGLLAASLAAAVLAAPWYLAQWQIVLPRLVAASADQAVPLWKSGAVFTYLRAMGEGFELPFYLLALVSLGVVSARRKGEDAWLLIAWFAAAFVFWTVVPNRQLRYLLPGLTPLAVLTMGSWPRGVLAGLCAFQLFSAANYGHGWIGRKGLDLGVPLTVFRTQPAADEDWRIGAILKEAARLHEGDLPFGNLTLVANHPRFNGPTFNWERKRHGVEEVRIRGVNRRLCEFSEFVLVKTGVLGPVSVVNQLPEVQRLMLDPDSWFQRGYRRVGSWPLPDRTEAVLFKRRRLRRPPFGERAARFDHYEERNFLAEGLAIDFGKWDARRGVYPRVTVRAPRIVLRGLEVRDVRVVMDDLGIMPVAEAAAAPKGKAAAEDLLSDFRFLRMSRLTFASGTVTEDAAAAFLKARVPQLGPSRFRLNKTVSAETAFGRVPLSAEVSVALLPDGRGLEVELERVAVAGIPLPLVVAGPYRRYRLGFDPNPELPFVVRVSGLEVADGRLRIGK
ncbi:MAG: LmeA family phospholipid-binding protein [Elusimicrobiota bacterium]